MMADQLPLDLEWPSDYSDEAFIQGPANQAAYDWIKRWPDWPQNTLAISGGRGAGKTHLASLAAEQSGAITLPACLLHQLEWRQHRHFVIENGPPEAAGEPILFHIINWVRECDGSLLITGCKPPAQWPVALADCASRLRAMMHVAIAEPDDTLLTQLLYRLFERKGVRLAPDVSQYIIARIERSFAGVKSCVLRVNHLSMVKKAPISINLVRQAMGWTAGA
ncbi:MAG: DnaA/Hda family protein [Pseudomonadota bacterium]